MVIDSQVSEPCSCRDTCSSVGSYRCHSALLIFPSVRLIHSALQKENRWNPNKSYSVGGEHLLPHSSLPLSLRVLTTPVLIDNPEQAPGPSRASVAPTTSCRKLLHNNLKHIPHDHHPRAIVQLSGWRNRTWRRRWYSSNLHHHCRGFLRSATMSTSAVRRVRCRR
jgi:hypothetical protein